MIVEFLTNAYSKLDGELSCSVFDHIPQDEQFPYLYYADAEARPDDTHGSEDEIVRWTCHLYSQGNGTEESWNLIEELDAIVRTPAFAYAGLTNIDRVLREVVPDGDGKTYHGIAEYRVRLEKQT
jgi:hypothetical protein